MASLMIIEMLFRVYHREVYLALCFSYCIHMIIMWFGLENMLVSYADDATLLACIPSPNMRSLPVTLCTQKEFWIESKLNGFLWVLLLHLDLEIFIWEVK